MRTKNLNLKKKIAFIASVAMIATTAAYLPNEVAQNIFNSSITVEAAAQVINTAFTNVYITDGGTNVLWKSDTTDATKWAASNATVTGFTKVDLATDTYASATALDTAAVNAIKVPFDTDEVGIKVIATGGGYSTTTDEIKTEYKSGKFSFGANDKFTATLASNDDKELSLNGIALTKASDESRVDNATNVNTFVAYVKVNNKYLGHSDKAAKPYKLFSSLSALKSDSGEYKAVVLAGYNATNSKHEYDLEKVTGTALTSTSTHSYDDVFTVDTTTAGTTDTLYIPASVLTESENVVSVSVEANKASNADAAGATNEVAGAVKSTVSSIEVTLDKHGHGKVPANSTKIEVQGDSYKKVSSGTGYAYKGDYEYLDLSGLKVSVLAAGTDTPGLGTIKTDKALDGGEFTDNSKTVTDAREPAKYSDNEGKDYLYRYVQSGKTYARNFVATLASTAEPGDKIVVDLDLKSNWTTPATSNGKITLTMDENGVAQSKVITVTNSSTGISESYIFTILNAELAGKTEFNKIKIGNVAGTTASTGEDFGTLIGATTGRVKVESEQVQKNINGSNKYVQYYTVYTNDDTKTLTAGITLDFTGSSIQGTYDATNKKINSKLHFVDDLEDTGMTVTPKANTSAADITAEKIEYDENTWIDVKGNKMVLKPGSGNSANVESPVMYLEGQGYFQVKFTNKYEIKLNDVNAETDYDGKVSVTGVTIDEKPADAKLGGHEFKGWYVNTTTPSTVKTNATNAGGYSEVFNTNSSLQQNNSYSIITPFTVLNAQYDANAYYVVYDSNGGKFVDAGSTFGTNYATVEVDEDDEKVTTVAKKRATYAAGDNADALTDAVSTYIQKPGFTFKGWALTADATVKATDEAFKAARPSVDKGEMKLYAVWEANEINVKFSNIDFDAKGLSKSGVNEADFLAAATAGFNSQADKSATFTAGQAFGTLPTPTLKGYTFDGWYRMKITKNSKDEKVYTATKVTDKTVIESKFLDGYFDNNTSDDITLYAKFKQNTYNVTTELGNGQFEWINPTDPSLTDKQKEDGPSDIVTYKYYAASASAGTTGAAHFFDEKDEDITAYLTKTKVVSGSGSYYKFKGFTINNATTKVMPEKLSTALGNYTTLSDITLKAQYEETTEKANGSIYFDPNEGSFYQVTVGTLSDPKTLVPAKNIWANSDENADGESVSSYITIKNNTIVKTSGNYYIARPGYKFTGWFEDEACTKEFNFDNAQYEGGKELKVYAGWAPESNQRYVLHYTLIDKNGIEVTFSQNDTDKPADYNGAAYGGYYGIADDSHYNFTATIMGKAGSTVKASEKTFEYKGIKYVFDAAASADSISEKELKVAYKAVGGLDSGKFIIDPDKYTVIQGYYVQEGYETKTELGKATNVKVSDKGAVTFTAADNAVKYQVCKIVDGKKYYSAKTDATTINITPAKKDYQVYVIAFDANGKSTHSATVNVTVKAALGTVKNPKVTESLEGDKKIGTVTWDAVEGATWYKVFKVVNGKTYWGSKVTENKYVFKNLPKDSSYIIYVAAGDDKGNVTYGARTKISKYPAVQNVKISADKKTVSFDKAEGAVNYQVAKLINGKTYYGTKSTSNSITMENAAKSGTQIFVLAFFTGDDGKTYSSYSQSITVE